MSKPAAIAKVLVIDDHPVVIQGLRCWLKDAHVKAVLEARDVTSGYRLFRRHHPDVVIIDLAVRGSVLGGLDVIRRMRAHNRRSCILVFSMHRNPAIAARAQSGCHRLYAQGCVPGRGDKGVAPGAFR